MSAVKDIVERLEAWKHGDRWPKDQCLDDDLAFAAYEITSLRGSLISLRDALHDALDGWRSDVVSIENHGEYDRLKQFLDDK